METQEFPSERLHDVSESENPSEIIPQQSNLFCSFERSVRTAESTLKQLASTKETFSNFEAFYKKFVAELNDVREEHRLELYKCQTRIDDLLKDKTALEEQLGHSRKQAKKYKEELAATKRKQAETEWENEKQGREISSLKITSERLTTEKSNLELEVVSLMKKLGSIEQLRSLTASKVGENSMLTTAKEELEQLEIRYRRTMEEKEALHLDIVSLQKRMGHLQAEYKNNEKELQMHTQTANVKAYKAEMQLKNITRQKETLASHLDECQKEVRKAKDRCLTLERQKIELQEMVETYKDEINVKRKQIETLNDLNQTLETKLDTMKKELCTPEASNELLASQDESFIQDLELSESRIQDLETSLQSTRNEKQDLERDITISRNKIIGLEESNQRSQEEIRELERHLTVARGSASALETELSKQTNRCTQLQGELNKLREQQQDLKAQLLDTNQRNSDMERKLEQALEENDEIKENSSLAERKLADLTELLKQEDERNNQLEEKISVLKNQVSKFEGKNESNMKQIANLKMEVGTEREKKGKVEKELLVINSRLDEAQRSAERINRENEIKDKFSGELKKVNKTNEERIQHLNEKLGKLEAKIEITEEEKRDFYQKVLDSQQRIKELEADNNLCVQEKDRLDLDILQLCKKINALQTNLNVCEHEKNEFEHQAALLQQKAKKYEAELTEIAKNNADLEARIQEAISSTCQSSHEVAELKKQVDEYRSAADEIDKQVAKKDKQLEKLREKIMTITAYSESVQDELATTNLMLQTRDKEKNDLEEQIVLMNDEIKHLRDMENMTIQQEKQLEGEVNMLRETLQGFGKDRSKSRDAQLMEELKQERAKATKELESLRTKIDSLETEAGASKKDVHVVTEDLQIAEEAILNLSYDLERSLEEKKEETRRLHLLENKLKDMEKDWHLNKRGRLNAEEEVCAAKKKIGQLESKIEVLDKNRNLLQDQLEDARDKLMKEKEEIMRLESKITERDKTNEYLNHVISRKDHVIEESRVRIKTCEAELDEVRKKVRKFQVTCEGLKAENMEIEKRHLMYQENIKKMEKDFFKQREVNNTLNHQVSAQKLQLDNLQNKIISLRKKRDHYKNEYESSLGSIRKAKQELLSANHRIRENEVFTETNLMKLKEKENIITSLRESKIALETELIFAKAGLETLRRHFEQNEENVQELERSLEEAGVGSSRTTTKTVDTKDDDPGDVSAQENRTESGEKKMKDKVNGKQKKLSIKDEEMNSLRRRISDLESQIHDLKSAKEKLEAIKEDFEKEKKERKREVLAANGKISELEVKLKYECQEKALAESLLNDSRKRTNELQEDVLKLRQQVVEKQLMNEKEDGNEKMDRDDPLAQLKAGKYDFKEADDSKRVEKGEYKNVFNQKNFTDHETESNEKNFIEGKEILSNPQEDVKSQRKSELVKEIANLHQENEVLRESHKETLCQFKDAKEDAKTTSTKCDELEKAAKLRESLEKQVQDRVDELGTLEDQVGEACFKLDDVEKESRIRSDEEKCSVADVTETCASAETVENMLERESTNIVSEEDILNVYRREGKSKGEKQLVKEEEKEEEEEEEEEEERGVNNEENLLKVRHQISQSSGEELVKEIEELRKNNDELKKEIYHLQAREALGQIQKASQQKVKQKLEEDGNHQNENEKIESQESDLSAIKMAYDTLIYDILKLSKHLQNYQLNIFEWEVNQDLIEVANERLLSCFSALQVVLSDLDASFKELNESICGSDSNSELLSNSMECNHQTKEKQISVLDSTRNKKNKDLENNTPADDIANLRVEICSLKEDNRTLRECNDKLIKTVKELEKKAEIVKEELQATEMMCTAASENVMQIEQVIGLLAPVRDEGREEVGEAIKRTGDSSDDMISKENVTNKSNVTNTGDVTSKHDVTSNDVTNKHDVLNNGVAGKKDLIQELQNQNQELKSQVKHYKDYKERVEALVCTLRQQIAILQKELEKYRSENMFGSKTRNNEFNANRTSKASTVSTRRLFNDTQGTSSSRFRHFPVKRNTATSIPSTNSQAEGLRVMSTPNPDREMESEQDLLPDISALNITEDIPENLEESLESSGSNKNQNCPLGQNENVSEEFDATEKGAYDFVIPRSCTEDSNDVGKFKQEKQEADDEKTKNDKQEDGKEELKNETNKKDMNDNLILEDKGSNSRNDNGKDSLAIEIPVVGNKEPELERRQASRSRGPEVAGSSVSRDSFRSSSLIMPHRSGLGGVLVYSGQMTGMKSASRTYPFTKKYF